MIADPDDRPTMVPCPKCDGEGMLREERGTEVRGFACDICDASGVVTVEVMRLFKIARASSPARDS